MTLNVLFAANEYRWQQYQDPLRDAFANAGLAVDLFTETDSPEIMDYIVFAPNGTVSDFSPFTRCKAVLNLWAGVEQVVGNQTLTQPLCRMVDAGLEEGMVEWVTGHVLRHHLGMDAQITQQDSAWNPVVPPLARDRTVTILGLGALGRACGEALAALRFNVVGWSASQKDIPGLTCLSGDDGLAEALRQAEIVVLLLPLTDATANLLNAERLALMPKGGVVINPGRGALIDDDALLAALNAGHIAHATLDVFRQEPLPGEHPFWAHPNVTVTPHIASETRPATASQVIAENIRRGEAGEPFLFLVDRAKGY
ncbi:2-hydroxyacid dehydrogenase [Actibacterium lipolyticum]|uniref:Glyoxylate/hydroxypyruvate reductase A n=1 Tax=Actibacterium lipolyticum TaxID=1524263 RepID=A0A238JLU3_9RHOB|nr:glyoxylate/hydroxypyruvate reductase A [Actibacterium lipolyticum]SMX31455.1 Glyoxylate/hydroxypyruvate reductase A [Actibacterium lipolyticum]